MPSAMCGGFKDDPAGVGKYLVLRRDGTIPDSTWFVLLAADPHTPPALRAYANDVMLHYPPGTGSDEMFSYGQDVWKEARSWMLEQEKRLADLKKRGDPEKGPHRKDSPLMLALMRGQISWADIERAWKRTAAAIATGNM